MTGAAQKSIVRVAVREDAAAVVALSEKLRLANGLALTSSVSAAEITRAVECDTVTLIEEDAASGAVLAFLTLNCGEGAGGADAISLDKDTLLELNNTLWVNHHGNLSTLWFGAISLWGLLYLDNLGERKGTVHRARSWRASYSGHLFTSVSLHGSSVGRFSG